jgi:hypothetical protein
MLPKIVGARDWLLGEAAEDVRRLKAILKAQSTPD